MPRRKRLFQSPRGALHNPRGRLRSPKSEEKQAFTTSVANDSCTPSDLFVVAEQLASCNQKWPVCFELSKQQRKIENTQHRSHEMCSLKNILMWERATFWRGRPQTGFSSFRPQNHQNPRKMKNEKVKKIRKKSRKSGKSENPKIRKSENPKKSTETVITKPIMYSKSNDNTK